MTYIAVYNLSFNIVTVVFWPRSLTTDLPICITLIIVKIVNSIFLIQEDNYISTNFVQIIKTFLLVTIACNIGLHHWFQTIFRSTVWVHWSVDGRKLLIDIVISNNEALQLMSAASNNLKDTLDNCFRPQQYADKRIQ